MISLAREKAMTDVFATGVRAYYCWADWGGWSDRKKRHFTSRTAPSAV